MICSKCGSQNDAGDAYCYNCGSSLAVHDYGTYNAQSEQPSGATDPNGYPIDGQQNAGAEPDLSVTSRSALAIRDAKRADISNMRPITRAAYALEDKDGGTFARVVVSLLFFGLCIGMVACLIAIFETFSKITQAATAQAISGSLSELYQSANGQNAQTLLWLVIIFIVLVIAFVVVGKLVLRMKKVRRKRRKDSLDEF